MAMNIRLQPKPVEYPDSDGQPMAENDVQYRWIVMLRGNIGMLLQDRQDVYVAADHLVYAREGDPTIRQAPDTYVVFGRPKRDRGSYRVWEEDGIFPQVVFEVLSPGNRRAEMARKFAFYDEYGAEEYYVIDPQRNRVEGYLRSPGGLTDIPDMGGWVSPRLGVRFDTSGPEPVLYHPDGRRFLTYEDLAEEARRAGRLAAKLRELGVDPDTV
jgi:Uma2 family endonuclease